MSEGKVTKYRVKNEAPFQVFEVESAEDKAARNLPYPERVARKLDICVIDSGADANELIFDLVGVDVSVANALRRILLAEVPTMAIEYVYMFMNSSIIHDEVFSHRLGLVPINVDPRMFEFIGTGEAENPTEFNTAVFKLDVKNPLHPVNPESLPKGTVFAAGPQRTMNVMSGALEWIPQGDQVERFPNGLAPVYDDILLAKLRPGQEIIAEMHCRKGIGKDHAKYSPVATVSYRLLPKITLKKELRGEEANRLIEKCPMNVFDIEDLGGGEPVAKVARPRDCTMCRECIREVGWGEKVSLERVADHFIFSIESVGALPPKVPDAVLVELIKSCDSICAPCDLLRDAIGVLKYKCDALIEEIEAYERGEDLDDAM